CVRPTGTAGFAYW
nr:immunoglobulin heavy chain junction region [Mus musculus]